MKKLLITGGAGYIGSIMVPRLLEEGYDVTVLDSLLYANNSSLFAVCNHPNFHFQFGDAREESTVKPLVAKADAILPLACLVGAPACERFPAEAVSTNFEAIALINRLRSPQQQVVYPTSNSGYGRTSGSQYCTEESPLDPVSLYGRTKSDAEKLLLETENVITLRLATVFGLSPRMRLDLLVNDFVHQAATTGYVVVFEKDHKRNYVHIRDIADCFVHCLANFEAMKGRPYNVGLDRANLSKQELVEAIQVHVPRFFVHYSEIGSDPDQRNYIVSNQRLSEAGFEASRSLEVGIVELLKGYAMLRGRGPMRNA